MTKIYESDIEKLVIELFETQGFIYLAPETQENERQSLHEVILADRLKNAIDTLNHSIPQEAKEQAYKQVMNLPTQNLVENNEAFHRLLTEGIEVEYMTEHGIKGDKVWLVDYEDVLNNEFVVTNQFTVAPQGSPIAKGDHGGTKRPDVILFVNGLPLVVIELKNPVDENATVEKAFTQLQNYKAAIPALFHYNSVLVASDGLGARAGSVTSDISRFAAWKSVDGVKEDSRLVPQMETLIKGMLNKPVLMDLIRHFTVYEKTKREDPNTRQTIISTEKKIAAYHQYFAVNKAVESTLRAVAISEGPVKVGERPAVYGLPGVKDQSKGDRKAGVVWHTQGSGKSLSMVFYAGKVVLSLDNPTIVVLTDRNDLDDQLFDTFAGCKQLLRQEPVQAESRGHLKKLLKVAGGGIVFTTIQKFSLEDDSKDYEMLSERRNIVVIADEAHRSQYGFAAKTKVDEKKGLARTSYGFAKYLRDAIPNATFIGFTGTPIEKEDASTPAVFGNYIDIYDISQAVEDNATVKIYYESRLVKVHLREEDKAALDDEVEAITEGEESLAKEKAKAKWAQLEAIVGHRDRLRVVAADILDHFAKRQEAFEGKGMIVCMSRRIAVELYGEIIKLMPHWHGADIKSGAIKVVMTSSSSDPESWQAHNTTKEDRREIKARFKDPGDILKLVIVRDMWLTGFDVPCLTTMYVDKPMRGHTLMQAIARVNRVFRDKPGGLIVDYIGIASDLKVAMGIYSASGGKGAPALEMDEALAVMREKYEVVVQMLAGYDYKKYFHADTREKLGLILETEEYVLGLPDGKNRFAKEVTLLSQAYALCSSHSQAEEIRDEVGFFQAIKARLVKFEPRTGGKSGIEIETAIRQIVDRAVVTGGVVDVYEAAGIKKPDISILSDEFLAEISGMKRKNLAYELLQKILKDEIGARTRKNHILSKKFSEMLERAIKRYQNNLLTTTEVIDALIELAKGIRASDSRGAELNLSDEELAFYDALANNESAKQVMGDKTLCELARILVKRVRDNKGIDWTLKESVQAKLRLIVKRTLREFGYPPDLEKLATENVLKQAALLADEEN